MHNILLLIAAATPLLVILMTFISLDNRIAIVLRKIDNFFTMARLTYLYAAFGPHLLISHFTVDVGMDKHTLLMFIGFVLTMLAVTFIKKHIVFTLASVGPLLIMTHFPVVIGLNVDTMLTTLGIIFVIVALAIMDERPEV